MSRFQYDPAKGKFRSYLKTLALRTIFQNLRQKRGQRTLREMNLEMNKASANPEVEALWEEEWRHYHVRLAMGRLDSKFNERDRQAFSHYVVKGRPATETAKVFGMSMDQVYQVKSRVLKSLGEMIARQVKAEG
jgi:RNA polymerase sigma factor (sigma-70 family)